jgi:hypothetical protein
MADTFFIGRPAGVLCMANQHYITTRTLEQDRVLSRHGFLILCWRGPHWTNLVLARNIRGSDPHAPRGLQRFGLNYRCSVPAPTQPEQLLHSLLAGTTLDQGYACESGGLVQAWLWRSGGNW